MLRMGLTEEQATAMETAMKGMVYEARELDRGEIEGLTRELANLRGGGKGAAGGFDLLKKNHGKSDKNSGKGNQESKQFDGYCGKCGKWGHRQRD